MKNLGETLRTIRNNKNLSQSQIAENIMSRQRYSNIEKELTEPSLSELQKILLRMNINIIDFLKIYESDKTIGTYKNLLVKGLKKELSALEATKLINYATEHRNDSNENLLLYSLTKSHLHAHYSSVIPKFNETDIHDIKIYIQSIQGEYSLYDLKIIGDFARFLSIEEIKFIYNKLPNYETDDLIIDNSIYRVQIHKIYNNFCDLCLAKNETEFAKKILFTHKKFAKTY
ncbi:helix-turn-helix transcriptional regulator, partial [Enterococcus faecalis]|nr:helix-turn-helix transcriptional regulator [Enterococcus faecalis]